MIGGGATEVLVEIGGGGTPVPGGGETPVPEGLGGGDEVGLWEHPPLQLVIVTVEVVKVVTTLTDEPRVTVDVTGQTVVVVKVVKVSVAWVDDDGAVPEMEELEDLLRVVLLEDLLRVVLLEVVFVRGQAATEPTTAAARRVHEARIADMRDNQRFKAKE